MTDSSGGKDARDAAYAAWFDRMRNKKAGASPADAPPADSAGYWTTDALFRQSELEAEKELEERAKQGEISGLLARLGLAPGADWATVNARYKLLAKEHHPDRNIDKTSNTPERHLEEMMELNRVFQTLRSLMTK